MINEEINEIDFINKVISDWDMATAQKWEQKEL